MEKLESEVRPVLEPMILGEQRELSDADQTVISRWALKTGMTLQHTIPGETCFPPEWSYTYVREHGEPSERHRVYIMAAREPGLLRWDSSKAVVIGRHSDGATEPNVFVSFLLAGRVALQVIADYREIKRAPVPPISPATFGRIWPVRTPFMWGTNLFPGEMVPFLAQSGAQETTDASMWWMPPADISHLTT
jgi:hypothetical protein